MLKIDLNISCLSVTVWIMHKSHNKINLQFITIITMRINVVIAEKPCESDTNNTPQNNVAVPVFMASISSLLLSSCLYGCNLN